MNALQVLPRRRGGAIRRLAWLSAAAMLAISALAPASSYAANPQPQDNACNNIDSGGRSPDYVWVTLGAAGVTVNWATDAAHFDAANYPNVTVRACVFDSNGVNQGAIDQNTENDGHQLFSWAVLGYGANPCPDSSLSFGGSADSPAVQTRKGDLIDCPAAPPSTPPSAPPSAPPSTPPSTPPSQAPSTPPSQAPSAAPSQAASAAPSQAASAAPSGEVLPIEGTPQPTGEVEAIQATPRVTPPPTDTISAAMSSSTGSWRIVLAGLAVLIAIILVATKPTMRVRRTR
jgi:hypothetical protein